MFSILGKGKSLAEGVVERWCSFLCMHLKSTCVFLTMYHSSILRRLASSWCPKHIRSRTSSLEREERCGMNRDREMSCRLVERIHTLFRFETPVQLEKRPILLLSSNKARRKAETAEINMLSCSSGLKFHI